MCVLAAVGRILLSTNIPLAPDRIDVNTGTTQYTQLPPRIINSLSQGGLNNDNNGDNNGDNINGLPRLDTINQVYTYGYDDGRNIRGAQARQPNTSRGSNPYGGNRPYQDNNQTVGQNPSIEGKFGLKVGDGTSEGIEGEKSIHLKKYGGIIRQKGKFGLQVGVDTSKGIGREIQESEVGLEGAFEKELKSPNGNTGGGSVDTVNTLGKVNYYVSTFGSAASISNDGRRGVSRVAGQKSIGSNNFNIARSPYSSGDGNQGNEQAPLQTYENEQAPPQTYENEQGQFKQQTIPTPYSSGDGNQGNEQAPLQTDENEKGKFKQQTIPTQPKVRNFFQERAQLIKKIVKSVKNVGKAAGLLARAGAALAAAFSNPVTATIIIVLIILLLLFLIIISINTRPATETAANDVIRNSMSKLTTGNLMIVTYPDVKLAQSVSYNAANEIQTQPKSSDGGRNIYEFKFVANYQIDLEKFINSVFYGASGFIEEYRVLITKIQETITFNNSNVEIKNISFFDTTRKRLSASPNYTIETNEETGLSSVTWTTEKSWWDSSLSYPCKMNQNAEKTCRGYVTFSIDYILKNNPNDFKNHMFSLSHEIKADVMVIRNAMGAQVSDYSLPEVVYNLCRTRTGGVFLCQVGSPRLEKGEDPWAGVTIESVRNEAISVDDLTLACPLDKGNNIICTAGRNYPRNMNNEYAGSPHNALDLVPNSINRTVYVASEAQRIKINNTNPMCGATVILYNGNLAILYAHVDGNSIASTSASLKNAMDQQNNFVEINDLQIGSIMGSLQEINGNVYFSNGKLCATGTHLHFTILKTDGTPVEELYDKVNQACEGKIDRCPDE